MKALSFLSSLIPKRGTLVTAADSSTRGRGDSILIPLAQDRLREIFEREQGPQKVRKTLESAFSGDMVCFQLLMDAMLDSWPLLQKNIKEVGRLASIELWEAHPFAKRNQKATPEAEALADEVYDAIITGMRPEPGTSEQDFEGMIEEIARGYYCGHYVSQILWENTAGVWRPRAVQEIRPPRYAYPWEGEDRLKIDLSPNNDGLKYVDFPADSFLIAINKGHGGHAAVAAPIRALVGYWLAAVYGLKWFSGFCEMFGIPWRHAKVGDTKKDGANVARAMALLGSNGYVVTDKDATIDILEAPSTGSALPSKELLELADRTCNLFILGQTLTSGTDGSGSRALGDVHKETLENVVRAVADYAGKVITRQLVPAYIRANYGEDREDAPGIWPKREAFKDEKAMAERDNLLGITNGATPVEAAWFYERHGIPMPKAGDALFVPSPAAPADGAASAAAAPVTPGIVAAADGSITWRKFSASAQSLDIPRSEMPQISAGNRSAMVSFFRSRGIESATEDVQGDTLKPTQAEYSPEKVAQAEGYKGGNRAILISADNYVVDGHHQWLGNGSGNIRAIRLHAPITRILMMAHRMPSTLVSAADAPQDEDKVAKLSEAVLEGLTGVTREWLGPVRPVFDRLAALAMSKTVSDEDFVKALEKAQKELPELFDVLDVQSLEDAFEGAISSAMISGSTDRLKP